MSSNVTGWKIGETRNSKVNFKKVIEDLRNQFPYGSLTAFVVESLANSIDAEANRIDIFVGKDTIKILDNGHGMTEEQFIEYHNLASLTKTRGGGIGFAGVGAKIYLDHVYSIYTETKSKKYNSATKWAFHGAIPRYTKEHPQNRVTHETGTYVEIKIKNSNDIKKLSPNFVISIIRNHYNAVLLGYYGEKQIIVNNNPVQPFTVSQKDIEIEKEFQIKVRSKKIATGYMIKSKKDVKEEFQGPQIVVHGKTITDWWFRQYPTYAKHFTGIIRADFLIDIVTTSKSDFDRSTTLWKRFNRQVAKALGTWLDEIGAKAKLPEPSNDLDSLSQKIEKNINKLLDKPEFSEIANKLYQNLRYRNVSIKNDSGEYKGIEENGGQKVSGTFGSLDLGEGVLTSGPDELLGIKENDQGEIPVKKVRRRAKSGIKISYVENPDELSEAWIDYSTQTITINQGHPSWKIAEKLNPRKNENVTFYHILRSIFKLLATEAGMESPEQTVKELFQGLLGILR
ncbi:ATP-binding protein [bacterium]|nr:ATP-binding protein [bacterium]